ncbi:hypothetical protein CR513_19147, partial [Mucuna pruriens]
MLNKHNQRTSKACIKTNILCEHNAIFTSRPLKLLYIDLFGPTRIVSVSGKRYILVVVDD